MVLCSGGHSHASMECGDLEALMVASLLVKGIDFHNF